MAPSALDTIFWVTTSTSPGSSGSAPPVAASASPIIASRSSPADLRHAGERDDLHPALSRHGAPPAPASARSRSSGVSMSSSRTPASSTKGDVGRRRQPRMPGPAVTAERGIDGVGGSSSSAFVPRPWRSGASTTDGEAAASPAARTAVTSAGRDGGQVGGQHQQPVSDGHRGPPGGRIQAARSLEEGTGTRSRATASTSASDDTTMTSITPGWRAGRVHGPPEQPLHEIAPLLGIEHRAQA